MEGIRSLCGILTRFEFDISAQRNRVLTAIAPATTPWLKPEPTINRIPPELRRILMLLNNSREIVRYAHMIGTSRLCLDLVYGLCTCALNLFMRGKPLQVSIKV